mmetsp:Transcript_92853/g.113739  ORF Transcript_92853/g.113739 Transcript_92853/m.113739 type:complete len:209 (+) Transcript_92853:3-629(+)
MGSFFSNENENENETKIEYIKEHELSGFALLKRMDSNAIQDDMECLIDKNIEIPKNIPFEITWELLKKIRIDGRFDLFHRHPDMLKIYKESVKKNKEIYADYESKLLNEFFGISLFKDNETGKLKANRDELKNLGKKMCWTVNKFPYNWSKNIKHELLWCTQSLTKKEIKDEIKKNIPNNYKVIWWVNPMKYRSVPGLYHAQIISKKR